MSYQGLTNLLNRKKQRFVCKPLGPNVDPASRIGIDIYHQASPGITEALKIREIEAECGRKCDLSEFLKNYSSIRLFCDTNSDASAFYIAHPDEWTALTEELNEWLDGLSEKEAKQLVPSWVPRAIVIGEVPNSGNYYLMPTDGADVHAIYEFVHDGFEFLKIHDSFSNFLDHITTITDDVIREIQVYMRLSDGETSIQWLPEQYTFDAS